MALKIKIGKTIEHTVKFSMKDGGKDVTHAMTLIISRPDQAALVALADEIKSGGINDDDILRDYLIDWKNQRLVVDEDDKPAAFSQEALELACTVAGVRNVLVGGIIKALVSNVRLEDDARTKN
ncbi:MAG TPA: hypothetical protein ENO09_07210 [bacterium]|nr:hypothetical protein [bacterium]